jgi:hypothetical protein
MGRTAAPEDARRTPRLLQRGRNEGDAEKSLRTNVVPHVRGSGVA